MKTIQNLLYKDPSGFIGGASAVIAAIIVGLGYIVGVEPNWKWAATGLIVLNGISVGLIRLKAWSPASHDQAVSAAISTVASQSVVTATAAAQPPTV